MGMPFLGAEEMILLGITEDDLPMRSALRKVGALLRTRRRAARSDMTDDPDRGLARARAAAATGRRRGGDRGCLLDYFEGWFDGDAVRMDRALHPGLAKHALGQDPTRSDTLDVTTKDEMVEATRQGSGRRRDLPDRAIRIESRACPATSRASIVHSAVYVEYVLLARTERRLADHEHALALGGWPWPARR